LRNRLHSPFKKAKLAYQSNYYFVTDMNKTGLSLSLILAMGAGQLRAQQTDNKLKLWYKEPAVEWTQALPLGNGRVGAMVFGGTNEELIQLNEATLWSSACSQGGIVQRTVPPGRQHPA
jgi:alpha-L-fucosidase 2